ncbi:MAG TPA: hypothetical protein VEB22_00785 [Phycisphaerales bacterium]|nr:hypothetical protein [Phycisphaerales bacterium]
MGLLADAAESWTERTKLRLMLGIVVVFVASVVGSCNQMRHLVWRQTASAKVDSVAQVTVRGRYGSTSDKIRVEYSFPDGELGTRKEEDDVSMTFFDPQQVANTGTVDVQYLPGTLERSRLRGHT